MDVEMTSDDTLHAVVQHLRYAGFPDASPANRRTGDPMHLLSVSADDEAEKAKAWGIIELNDPGARPIT